MLKDILKRIDQRLSALNLKESAAAKSAGLSDSAIRDIRRDLVRGKDRGVSSKTIFALAPILETSPAWLLDGTGPEMIPPELYLALVELQESALTDVARKELVGRVARQIRFEITDQTSRRDTAA